jgi:hypothetical protein
VLGACSEPAGTGHVERLNGALRDRLNALTRKTHAFAKRDVTWDALLGLQLFDHNAPKASLRLAASADHQRASVSATLSGDGPRANRSSLVVPGGVDLSRSCHPLKGSLPKN